jgi:hypothetical protein
MLRRNQADLHLAAVKEGGRGLTPLATVLGVPGTPSRKLIISVDVEEASRFRRGYPPGPPTADHVHFLDKLAFVSKDFRCPLTLLPTCRVVEDPAALKVLERWRDEHGAEIGAHLAPSSTPPFAGKVPAASTKGTDIPRELLNQKIANLMYAIESRLGVKPDVFRMGQFDFSTHLLHALEEWGFTADTSLIPLYAVPGVSEQFFLAPTDPFRHSSLASDRAGVWEVPLTMVSRVPGVAKWMWSMVGGLSKAPRENILSAFQRVGVVGTQPTWYSLAAMKQAARLHFSRGGCVIHMSLRSSDLFPGATSQFATERDVVRLLNRIRKFLAWIHESEQVVGSTLSAYCSSCRPPAM